MSMICQKFSYMYTATSSCLLLAWRNGTFQFQVTASVCTVQSVTQKIEVADWPSNNRIKQEIREYLDDLLPAILSYAYEGHFSIPWGLGRGFIIGWKQHQSYCKSHENASMVNVACLVCIYRTGILFSWRANFLQIQCQPFSNTPACNFQVPWTP